MNETSAFAAVEARIRQALEAQGFFRLLGAKVDLVAPGRCTMSIERRPDLMQQNGIYHGGAIAFLMDNATTTAAGTVVRAGQAVITAEYKLNILAPANGERLVCEAEVVKPGRMLTVAEGRVYSHRGEEKRLVAIGLATIANISLEQEGKLKRDAAV